MIEKNNDNNNWINFNKNCRYFAKSGFTKCNSFERIYTPRKN